MGQKDARHMGDGTLQEDSSKQTQFQAACNIATCLHSLNALENTGFAQPQAFLQEFRAQCQSAQQMR
ncbi:Uncharacterised protein [Chlamydia trachomatis]|nr:Uncharacterised protein [Chlamydia trachomatis]